MKANKEEIKDCWAILISTAKKFEVISLDQVSNHTNLKPHKVISALGFIKKYCMENELMDLTLLIDSNHDFDLEGVNVKYRDMISQEYFWLYDFEWHKLKNPFL